MEEFHAHLPPDNAQPEGVSAAGSVKINFHRLRTDVGISRDKNLTVSTILDRIVAVRRIYVQYGTDGQCIEIHII